MTQFSGTWTGGKPDFIAADVVVPPTGPAGRIYSTCENTLAVLRDIFAAAGVVLPELQFVSNGAVAYDDTPPEHGEPGLLAVEAMRLRPGAPGIPALMAVKPGTPYSLEMQVHLLRRVPMTSDQGFPPASVETDLSAQQLLLDQWLIYEGLLLGTAAGSAGDPGQFQGAPYRKIMLQEATFYGPAGGLGGSVFTIVSELI